MPRSLIDISVTTPADVATIAAGMVPTVYATPRHVCHVTPTPHAAIAPATLDSPRCPYATTPAPAQRSAAPRHARAGTIECQRCAIIITAFVLPLKGRRYNSREMFYQQPSRRRAHYADKHTPTSLSADIRHAPSSRRRLCAAPNAAPDADKV